MEMEPENKLLAALFRTLREQSNEESDLNTIAAWALGDFPPEAGVRLEDLVSLDPDLAMAMKAVRDYSREEGAEGEKLSEPARKLAKALGEAQWHGSMRAGYTKEGMFRVSDPQGELLFSTWIETVFRLARKIADSPDCGVWPSDEVRFSWPREKPTLQAGIQVWNENPVLTVRRHGSTHQTEELEEIKLDCWRGSQWLGVSTLWEEEPELVLSLEPERPYFLVIRGAKTSALKLVFHQVEFSPGETRLAAALRVLSGDVAGGFEWARRPGVSHPRGFRWVLGLLSQCLPEPARKAGFTAARDAAVQEETRADLRELFGALAAGWLAATGQPADEETIEPALEERRAPAARGFLLALRGAYEDALSIWDLTEETASEEPHILAGRRLAGQLCSKPVTSKQERGAIADRDLETAIRCAAALEACGEKGNEEFDRLEECLRAACR